MSDDLIKRLRSGEHWPKTAADRIAELERENARLFAGWHGANKEILSVTLIAKEAEAKLAKAMEALRLADKVNLMPPIVAKTIHAVLAELEGKDE